MRKPLVRSLAMVAFAVAAIAAASPVFAEAVIPKLVPVELSARLAESAPPLVLDVRSDAEWNAGHIAGAMHIPVDEVEARLAEIPRDRDVVVHCAVGPRANRAEATLAKAGYERVIHLEGGFLAWSAAGLPIEK